MGSGGCIGSTAARQESARDACKGSKKTNLEALLRLALLLVDNTQAEKDLVRLFEVCDESSGSAPCSVEN